MDRQTPSSPPHHLEPPPIIASNLQHQSQAMEEAPSPGLHFHQFATMDSSEPGQNPTLPSFSHGFSPVAQDSQVGTDVNSPIDLTSPSESINFVPPADPTFLETRRLPAPQVTAQPAAQVNVLAPFQVAPQPATHSTILPYHGCIDFNRNQNTPNLLSPVPPPLLQSQAPNPLDTVSFATSIENQPGPVLGAARASSAGLKRAASPVERPSKSVKVGPSSSGDPTNASGALPTKKGKARARDENAKPIIPVDFIEVVAHTAKCDFCDKRNHNGMLRCADCGWQICHGCVGERGGVRSHGNVRGRHMPREEIDQLLAESPDQAALISYPRAQEPNPLLDLRPSENIASLISPARLPPLGEFTNTRPTAAPESESTPAPKSKGTRVAKSTSTPAVKSTSTPAVKSTSTPAVKSTSTSAVKSTSTPTVKSTSTSAVKSTSTRVVKSTSTRAVKPTSTSAVKSTSTRAVKSTSTQGELHPPKASTSKAASPFVQQGSAVPSNNSPNPRDDSILPRAASIGTQTDGADTLGTDGWKVYGKLDVARKDTDVVTPKTSSPEAKCLDSSYYGEDLSLDSDEELSSPPADLDDESSVVSAEVRAAKALIEMSSKADDHIVPSAFARSLFSRNVNPEDLKLLSEEYRNPRRNPSRRARPIDMKV